MSVQTSEWLDLFKKEYLQTFVCKGGSVVKVLVANAPLRESVAGEVARQAKEANYLVAHVDAAVTRCHMMQGIFFKVAEQIDWEGTTDKLVRRVLTSNGMNIPDDVSLHDHVRIAAANSDLPVDYQTEVQRNLHNRMLRALTDSFIGNRMLAMEFRAAALWLASAAVKPNDVAPGDVTAVGAIESWLKGEKIHLNALKPLQIYQKIERHNARLLLHSLARWAALAGWSGLCLTVDLGALHGASTIQPAIKYNAPALYDAYEVLRVFIDETDESAHLAVVALADTAFLDDDKRSVKKYIALDMRLVQDVTGVTDEGAMRDNPLSAMVRLSAE